MSGGLLLSVFLSVLAIWVASSAAVLSVSALGTRRIARFARALAWLGDNLSSSPQDTYAELDRLIGSLPFSWLLTRVIDPSIPQPAAQTLSDWLHARFRDRLIACASASGPRALGCRVEALRVLTRARSEHAIPLLQRALDDANPQVVAVAVNLLGSIPDRHAAGALIMALRSGRYQASRIASALDRFPLPIADLLTVLASDDNPVARFWGATLLSRYATTAGVATDVARLVHDTDPQVRKAAIETLAASGDANAAPLALGLLGDPVSYVRAHAARALGELGRADLASHVLPLLADREWWVRQAAKESLVKMGTEVWRNVLAYLDHADGFARNGAAEVLQNLGVLDSMIVLQATSPNPSPEKIERLRKIAAAGGVRMTNALLDRTDAALARRIRALLDTLGLQAAGV